MLLATLLLQLLVGKGTFLTYLCQITVVLGAKPNTPKLWELAQEERDSENFCALVGQSRRVGLVSMRKKVGELESPYFLFTYAKQRACVCSSLLMKLSDSGITI